MLAGRLLLTDFVMDAQTVTLQDPEQEREALGVIAALYDRHDRPTATITIPLTPESAVELMVKMAALLTPEQHVDLLSKLSTKGSGILLAKPGDEATVARNLRSV